MRKFKQLIRWLIFLSYHVRYYGVFRSSGRSYCARGTVDIHPGGTITMGSANWIERGYTLSAVGGKITLGSNCYFNRNVKVVCYESIAIGDDCLVGDSVHIYDQDHNFSDVKALIRTQGYVTKPVKIGSNVWIGAKVTILKGVTIGDGAVIGANSLVTKDIPANAIAVGNPAAIVKMRS